MLTSKEIAHLAVKALDDKLARDIQILKTDKVTVLADYFILCTAGNSTHGKTLADEVDKVLSQAGEQPLRGLPLRRLDAAGLRLRRRSHFLRGNALVLLARPPVVRCGKDRL